MSTHCVAACFAGKVWPVYSFFFARALLGPLLCQYRSHSEMIEEAIFTGTVLMIPKGMGREANNLEMNTEEKRWLCELWVALSGYWKCFFSQSFMERPPERAHHLTGLSHASAVLPGLNECSLCSLDWN